MNRIKDYFTPLLTGVIVLSLSSCTSIPTHRKTLNTELPHAETLNTQSTNQSDVATLTAAPPQQETPVATQPLDTTDQRATSTAQSTNTVPVTIYRADTQCQTLVPEKVAVPAGNPVDAAVGKVLKQAESGDFDLAGYRVKVNAKSGVATVDLRRTPDSQRQFVSLSTCEQFALFGSLRKTLTDNSRLKIKDVRFTEQGQELVM
jgi:hypothetical protein